MSIPFDAREIPDTPGDADRDNVRDVVVIFGEELGCTEDAREACRGR